MWILGFKGLRESWLRNWHCTETCKLVQNTNPNLLPTHISSSALCLCVCPCPAYCFCASQSSTFICDTTLHPHTLWKKKYVNLVIFGNLKLARILYSQGHSAFVSQGHSKCMHVPIGIQEMRRKWEVFHISTGVDRCQLWEGFCQSNS